MNAKVKVILIGVGAIVAIFIAISTIQSILNEEIKLNEISGITYMMTKTFLSISDSSSDSEVIVCITETGSKYHRKGCQYLWKSCISISLSEAKDWGYTPCKKCNPPK